jgi:8-hydroxy-5-deazaflavin:NADPH oxidoreductase
MNILIIGSGNMGRGIATRLLEGHSVITLYDIDPSASTKLAGELRSARPTARVSVANSVADAVPASDIVILASWYGSNLDVARSLGRALDGKVVVDISNPLNETFDGLVTPPGTSAAETIREVLPSTTRLVKAFNTTFAGTLVDGHVAGQPLNVFLAGDDDDAKQTLGEVIQEAGMRPVDTGALQRSRELEALGLLGITLQSRLGTGFMSGWHLVLPTPAGVA